MRRSDKSFDPFSESPVDGVIAAHCSIQVVHHCLSCLQLIHDLGDGEEALFSLSSSPFATSQNST